MNAPVPNTARHSSTNAFVDERHCWLLLPKVRRIGAEMLLHQQCWCWGYDARQRDESGGNVLLRYGFTRHRPPENKRGATMYRLNLDENCRLSLWGFGLLYGERARGAVFLGRHHFSARYGDAFEAPEAIWKVEQLSHRAPHTQAQCEATQHLVGRAFEAVADYEAWIEREFGADYRRETLRAWRHPCAAPRGIEAQWRHLAQVLPPSYRVLSREV